MQTHNLQKLYAKPELSGLCVCAGVCVCVCVCVRSIRVIVRFVCDLFLSDMWCIFFSLSFFCISGNTVNGKTPLPAISGVVYHRTMLPRSVSKLPTWTWSETLKWPSGQTILPIM